jgi:putative transposase
MPRMASKPKRYQRQGWLHFGTFSCYQRRKLLDSVAARETFENQLERVRIWYGCYVTGYVVMPEHVHLLISEPERGQLSVALQMLKQITSRQLCPSDVPHFWQVRYYDFSVWSEKKRVEKLRYIHRNPVVRGQSRSRVPMDGALAGANGYCAHSNTIPPFAKDGRKGGATSHRMVDSPS